MLFQGFFADQTTATPTATDELRSLVARSMPGADAESAAIVGAVAGLCAVVAYADRAYTASEQEAVRKLLSRIQGLPQHALEGMCTLLEQRIADLAHESIQTCTRVLYERTERQARLEVLDVLVDLAAADEALGREETDLLRRISAGLGLAEEDYVVAQSRHRERLSILRAT